MFESSSSSSTTATTNPATKSTQMPLVDPVTMSPTATKTAKAQSVSGKPNEPQQLHPVHLNSTAASQAARHVLPVVVASLFLASFKHLVADPVPTMTASLPVVALLQVLYAFLCLPAAGSGSPKNRKPKPGEKKKAGDGTGPSFIIVCCHVHANGSRSHNGSSC